MGQNKYQLPHKPTNFELECGRCGGPSYFETTYENCFFVHCHMCEWEAPNPQYKAVISDKEMLAFIAERWADIRANVQSTARNEPPDVYFAPKYSDGAIYAKLDELDHRGMLDWGVSLRTAWLSDKGIQYLENL